MNVKVEMDFNWFFYQPVTVTINLNVAVSSRWMCCLFLYVLLISNKTVKIICGVMVPLRRGGETVILFALGHTY